LHPLQASGTVTPLFPSLNGRMLDTLDGLVADGNDVVRWYYL
jgi:hypothetical protein